MAILFRHSQGSCPIRRFVPPPPRSADGHAGIPALLAFRIAPLTSREQLEHAGLELPHGSAELRVLAVRHVGSDWEVVAEVL